MFILIKVIFHFDIPENTPTKHGSTPPSMICIPSEIPKNIAMRPNYIIQPLHDTFRIR